MSQKDIQTNLCKGIRACGLPKAASLEILNTITKWWKCNGQQWTVDRLKAYKQWYETCLAGQPEPPAYFRKTKDGYPTGCFGRLFRVRNQAKVLAVLSAGTVFQADELLPAQRKKFVTALKGDHKRHTVDERDLKVVRWWGAQASSKQRPVWFPDVVLPTPEDMTGTSIPLVGRKSLRLPSDPYDRVHLATHALMESWRSIPQAVLDYLDRLDHLDWIPENLSDIPYTPRKRVVGNPMGGIGFLQEPGLRLRSIANPNRVAQALSRPLAEFWEAHLRLIPTDYTFDQDSGCRWVQEELRAGHVLAGSDLSSATDLLDLEGCLQLARAWCHGNLSESRGENAFRYHEAEVYFTALSRGEWETPASSGLGRVRWEQGQPLGLYPSFRLLAITNNVIGMLAARDAHLPIRSSFAVIGDDFICRAEMAEAYNRRIEALGGTINRSKTITSNKVAEFAGRVITPDRVMLKTIKFKLPSDDSFMSVVSDLGPQARNLLGHRQRKAWDTFKYVPGIVYDGPWSQDSFGEPLVERIAWTESTTLVDEVPDPDPVTNHLEQLLIRAAVEEAVSGGTTVEEVLKDYPWPIEEDIQSILVSGAGKPSGDPRRVNGRSTLERLEKVKSEPGFLPYPKFKEASSATHNHGEDAETSATPTLANIAADVSARALALAREQDSEDGDKPEVTPTTTGGIQQMGEPAKGPSEPTVGSKPAVVARPTTGRAAGGSYALLQQVLASQDAEDTPLEEESPQNPDMPV